MSLIVILMGVSGSGKTTIGQLLAAELGCGFYDGDDFHPPENIAKMRHGDPLTDEDRFPWLDALRGFALSELEIGRSLVIACSALKEIYRERLQIPGKIRFVHLRGDFALIEQRLATRGGHFMDAGLLQSQFDALEEPTNAIAVEISDSPAAIVGRIRELLDRKQCH